MTEQEIIYTMALTRVPRVNTAAQHRLMEELGSASAVFDHRHHIRDFYPEASDKLSATLQEMEVQVARAEEELEFTRKHHIKCLCYHDTDYPSRLRECDDAPLLLYYKGNADLNRTAISPRLAIKTFLIIFMSFILHVLLTHEQEQFFNERQVF